MNVGISLLSFYFYLLCYAAVLINFTYYAQYYAHVKDLCLGIQYFAIKIISIAPNFHGKISMITKIFVTKFS